MTKNELIKEICKREGKKSQVAIGNVREIVAVIEQLFAEEMFDAGVRSATPIGNGIGAAITPNLQRKLTKLWAKADKAAAKLKR